MKKKKHFFLNFFPIHIDFQFFFENSLTSSVNPIFSCAIWNSRIFLATFSNGIAAFIAFIVLTLVPMAAPIFDILCMWLKNWEKLEKIKERRRFFKLKKSDRNIFQVWKKKFHLNVNINVQNFKIDSQKNQEKIAEKIWKNHEKLTAWVSPW